MHDREVRITGFVSTIAAEANVLQTLRDAYLAAVHGSAFRIECGSSVSAEINVLQGLCDAFLERSGFRTGCNSLNAGEESVLRMTPDAFFVV